MYDAQRIVWLDKKTCTCGRWQVSGILCLHACAAIYMHKQRLEECLDNCYKMEKYMQWYAGRVYGIESPHTWPADDPCDAILPPNIQKASSRLNINCKRVTDEPINPYKLTRSEYFVKRANCGGLGYYYKGCHFPLNLDWKRWKPKKYKLKNDATKTNVQLITFSSLALICLHVIEFCFDNFEYFGLWWWTWLWATLGYNIVVFYFC